MQYSGHSCLIVGVHAHRYKAQRLRKGSTAGEVRRDAKHVREQTRADCLPGPASSAGGYCAPAAVLTSSVYLAFSASLCVVMLSRPVPPTMSNARSMSLSS